jgi:integrating conjugative element protein (TIGR03758 family)
MKRYLKICCWLSVGWVRPQAYGADNEMFNDQRAAFQSANSGATQFDHTDSITLISASVVVVAMMWFAWVVLNAYRAWGAGVSEGMDAGSQVLRALFVTIVTMLIVSY